MSSPFRRRQCPPNTFSYVVRRGDTYYRLAQRFSTTIPALVSANPLIDPNKLEVGQTLCIPRQKTFPACPEGNFYTIQTGDSLFAIARKFGVSLDDLLEANPGVDPQRLTVGQVICIPLATPPVTCPPGTSSYTIQAGDTFFKLARHFGVSVDALLRANPKIDPDRLLIGQIICIPKK